MAAPPVPKVPTIGTKKKAPTNAKPGLLLDSKGKPVLDKNNHYIYKPNAGVANEIPTSSTPSANKPYVLGTADNGTPNTEFKNYEYQSVPGSANLFGTVQGGTPVGTMEGSQGIGQGANPFQIKLGRTTKASNVMRSGDLHPDDAMQRFATLDPTARATIEYQLYQGGFYTGTDKFVPGAAVTDADRTAFAKLLRNSIKTGQPVDQLLANTAAIGKAGVNGAASGSNQIRPIVVTPEATLDDSLKQAFVSALGRAPSAAEYAKFSATFHAAQVAKANASGLNDDGTAITADGTPVGGSSTTPYVAGGANVLPGVGSTISPTGVQINPALATPANTVNNPIVQGVATPDVAAAQMAQQTDPTGMAAHSLGERAQDFYTALTSSPGGSISTVGTRF